MCPLQLHSHTLGRVSHQLGRGAVLVKEQISSNMRQMLKLHILMLEVESLPSPSLNEALSTQMFLSRPCLIITSEITNINILNHES